MRATIRLCLETRPCHQGHPAPRRGRSLSSPAVPAGPAIPVRRDGCGGLCVQCRPLRPPSPELEELSKHRSCERPSVGPAALLWSPCSEAARPALPCWAQGARACQGRLRQLGSHWAPAGDGWPPPWCCLRAPLHPLPGASSQPRHQTLPTRTSGPPPLPVPSHDPASRPSGLLLGSGRMWQRQDHRSQLRVAGGCGIPVLSRKQP